MTGALIFGFIAAAVAILGFGVYAVPVGLVDSGDGIFFQFLQSSGILLVGFIVNLAFGADPMFSFASQNLTHCDLSPYPFEPIAMVGGMLWTLGNCTVVPIVGFVGLGLGIVKKR